MELNKKIFREYDIRGIYNEELDEELERSLNTSFILDVPSMLFEEKENEKTKKLVFFNA